MQKILKYLWFPIFTLAVLAIIYGGLGFQDLKNNNQELSQKQITQEEKIVTLEESLFQNKEAVSQTQKEIAGFHEQLEKYQKDLAYYKNLATAPRKILGAAVAESPEEKLSLVPTEKVKILTNTVTEYVSAPVQKQASVIIDGVGSYKVNVSAGDTAFSILQKSASQNRFVIEYQTYEGLGVFVTSIAGIKPSGNQYWAFYYNGKYSLVGASSQKISSDDTTFWRLESF